MLTDDPLAYHLVRFSRSTIGHLLERNGDDFALDVYTVEDYIHQ